MISQAVVDNFYKLTFVGGRVGGFVGIFPSDEREEVVSTLRPVLRK